MLRLRLFCVCFWQNFARSWKMVLLSQLRQLIIIKMKKNTSWLREIKRMFCKYHQLHLFIKCQQKTPTGQTLYRTLSLHIYSGWKIYLNSDRAKSGRSNHFSERTECTSWFFRLSVDTKLNCPLKLSSLIEQQKF